MIKFINLSKDIPFRKFKKKYDDAMNAEQINIEAISISSYSKKENEVSSRYVNLKFVDKNNFIFFSNYNSPKSYDFATHNQISALIYWNSINLQIRLKAYITKTSNKYNQDYFKSRDQYKNAIAISSNQSKVIKSYEMVKEKYNNTIQNDDLTRCPDHWGGFSFSPYYFEFWEGHNSRMNQRVTYKLKNKEWHKAILEP